MFTLKMFHNSPKHALTVCIDGCPEEGLAAVDFRRSHGLEEAPSDLIDLTPAELVDEKAARSLPLNGKADFEPIYQFRQAFAAPSGAIGMRYPSNWGRDNCARISAEAIRDWQAKQTPESAVALFQSVLEIDRRERDKAASIRDAAIAEEEAKRKAIENARELLKDEIAKKDSRIAYLEGELAEAREKIESLEAETV